MTARKFTSMWKKYTVVLLCCFTVAVIFIGTNSVIQVKGEENQAIKERLTALTTEKNRLLSEKAVLSSPQRIETVAAESLGMVKVTEEHQAYYQDPEHKETDSKKQQKTTTE